MQGSWKITYFYFTATTTRFTTVWFWQKTILTFTTFIFLLHPRLVLPSPCHDQDNSCFVSLLHSYIMIKRKIIWLLRSLHHDLRVKRYFFHEVTMFTMPWLREKSFFSFQHYVQYAMVTEEEIWLWLNHYFDYTTIMKKRSFLFHRDILWKYLLTNMCNLKNFLPQEFQGSLTWFTSPKNSRVIFPWSL